MKEDYLYLYLTMKTAVISQKGYNLINSVGIISLLIIILSYEIMVFVSVIKFKKCFHTIAYPIGSSIVGFPDD